MTSPPIAVGIPVYNGGNYLAEAIASLRAQIFGDFRLIISDNASTDNTEDICRQAARDDPRIEYHRQPTNLGAPANYNFTVARSQSEFFMWHAHDDLRAPAFLGLAYEAFRADANASLVFSKAARIGPHGEERGMMPRSDDLLSPLPYRRLRAVIVSPQSPLMIFGLIRRSVLESTWGHGAFKGADRVLAAELVLLGAPIELPEVLFFNRDHPGRYTRLSRDKRSKSAWWDPATAHKISLPRWKGVGGYLRAVHRHPLSAPDRLRSYLAVGQSLFANDLYIGRQLARDANDAMSALGQSVRSRLVASTRTKEDSTDDSPN
ncbi:MAG: glycosyltransferase family 2 protein [Acidimicrobiia bacterium]